MHGKCRMASASMGVELFHWVCLCVACHQWVWHVFSVCGMSSVGEACRQWVPLWVWYVLSVGGMSPVGVSVASVCVCMASMGVV